MWLANNALGWPKVAAAELSVLQHSSDQNY
jgi:hypothetical protein